MIGLAGSNERAIRPIALGRKRWLFAGSDRGARAAAIAFSRIQTCKRHAAEPLAYLADGLRRLPSHPINRLAELLPLRCQSAAQAPPPRMRLTSAATGARRPLTACKALR
ncbi:MAG: transposase domain-containing protein [Pseudomonadota bacterium]